jgi:hypothetical protein
MPKKILVIDDDPKMLVLEKTILVQGGFARSPWREGIRDTVATSGTRTDQRGTLQSAVAFVPAWPT